MTSERKTSSTVGRRSGRGGFAQNLARIAAQKLDMINAAHKLDDLRVPPGYRRGALRGDLVGSFSSRVNDQWRIVFGWTGDRATDVQIVDYHR